MEELSLGLNQLQVARFEYLSEHICNWSEHSRPFSTLAVMQKGNGRFVTTHDETNIACGDIFFIPAGSKYMSYWTGESNILYFAIHFHFENRHSAFSPQRFSLQKIEGLVPDKILPKFETLYKCILEGGIARLKACGYFYTLYSDILPLLKSNELHIDTLSNIRPAVDYIEKHSDKDITVKSLAQMCALSESRFYVLFQKIMDYSPISYRNNIRIRRAVNMLDSEYTIEEIAANVGFSSAIYFRRIFKEIMGKLPSEYRKNLKFNIDELTNKTS